MAMYYEFEVSLVDTKPRVWRRFLIRKYSSSFLDLSDAIQEAAGWQNAHMWQFTEPKPPHDTIAYIPAPPDQREFAFDPVTGQPLPQAHMINLGSYFKSPKDTALYIYDFGDNWEHRVTVKQMVDLKEKFYRRLTGGRLAFPTEDFGDNWEHRVTVKQMVDLKEKFYRRLTGGRLAFPTEDCGGVPGYYACIAAVQPDFLPESMREQFKSWDLDEQREWMEGIDWRPDQFNLKSARESFDINDIEWGWAPIDE